LVLARRIARLLHGFDRLKPHLAKTVPCWFAAIAIAREAGMRLYIAAKSRRRAHKRRMTLAPVFLELGRRHSRAPLQQYNLLHSIRRHGTIENDMFLGERQINAAP